jgi:hypothetical protein
MRRVQQRPLPRSGLHVRRRIDTIGHRLRCVRRLCSALHLRNPCGYTRRLRTRQPQELAIERHQDRSRLPLVCVVLMRMAR